MLFRSQAVSGLVEWFYHRADSVTSTLALFIEFCYNAFAALPQTGNRRGVDLLEILVNFLVSFVASVVGDYVSKWLERHGKGK